MSVDLDDIEVLSLAETLDIAHQLVADVVEELGIGEGDDTVLDLDDLAITLKAARNTKDAAAGLAFDLEKQLCKDRKHGSHVEAGGAIFEIMWSTYWGKCDNDALRSDIRNHLLYDENGEMRTAAQLLDDILWADKTGLQPLNQSMRTGVFHKRFGMKMSDYATAKTSKRAKEIS